MPMSKETEATQVVVGAGGEAKRMGLNMPKPLVKLGDSTLIDRCVGMFSACGFKDFIFLLGYKDEKVTEHIDGGRFDGINVSKSYDYAQGIEMGKAITHAIMEGKIDKSRRSLMVWPDDIFLDRELPAKVIEQHASAVKKFGVLSSAVVAEAYRSPYGLVNVDNSGLITSFEEKPLVHTPATVGIYIFEPGAYKYFTDAIDLNKPGSAKFEELVMPALAREKKVYAVKIPPDTWFAINTQKELEQAQKLVEAGRLPRS